MSGRWWPCPVEAWHDKREKPWTEICTIAALRWWEGQVRQGQPPKSAITWPSWPWAQVIISSEHTTVQDFRALRYSTTTRDRVHDGNTVR